MMPTQLRITRDLKPSEACGMRLKKGDIVWEFGGCTYGCISRGGIAVMLKLSPSGKSYGEDCPPFFEVPQNAVEEIKEA